MSQTVVVTDLGPASSTASIGDAVALGDRIYLTTRGTDPTRIVEYDLTTDRVTRTFDLPTGAGSWAVVASGGMLYAGTHIPGDLYRIDPQVKGVDGAVSRVTPDTFDEFIWTMAATPDGRLVLGTSAKCLLLVVDPDSGEVTDVSPAIPGQQYLRAVVADERDIYAGLGMRAELVRVERASGRWHSLLPQSLANRTLVYSLAMDSRRVVAGISPHGEVAVVTRSRDPLLCDVDVVALPPGSSYIPAISLQGDSAIVAARPSGIWYDVDLRSGIVSTLGTPRAGSSVFAFLRRDGVVYGFLGEGAVARYEMGTGEFSVTDLSEHGLEPRAELPMSMGAGPDQVLVGGKGGVQIHDLATGCSTRILVPGEPKVIGATSVPLVFGVYDPAQLGLLDPGDVAVRIVADFGHEQTRPQGIAVDTQAGVALISTQPDIGRREGALTLVHLASHEIEVRRGIIAGQSLYGVAIEGRTAYVGGDVQPGYGLEPVDDTAGLVALDLDTWQPRWTCRPIPGAARITGICVAAGMVYCLTGDGRMCTVDPADGRVLATARAGEHGGDLISNGDQVYGTSGHEVFRVSAAPGGLAITPLAQGLWADWYSDPKMVLGSDGALYTVRGRNLVRIEMPTGGPELAADGTEVDDGFRIAPVTDRRRA